MSEFPPEIQPHLESLDKIEKEFENVEADIMRYTQKVEKPLYNKRDKVIEKIPQFWLTAMSNHTIVNQMIEPEDEEALSHLSALNVTYPDEKDPRNYTVTFTFEENPYFSDKTLSRSFTYIKDEEGEDQDIDSPPTTIKWKSGKSLIKSKESNGKSKSTNEDSEDIISSFFEWFTEPSSSPLAVSIGQIICDEIYPNAVAYYKDEEVDEFDGGDFDEDEDDEDEAEEDEEDEEKPASKKAKTS